MPELAVEAIDATALFAAVLCWGVLQAGAAQGKRCGTFGALRGTEPAHAARKMGVLGGGRGRVDGNIP